MKKGPAATNPDAYVESLDGWRRDLVDILREGVLSSSDELEETIKWGHIVYQHDGPVLLIRAEQKRVLFGFWRGKRLTDIEPRLKPSGKYEMASLELREGMEVAPNVIRELTIRAVSLNRKLGDPRKPARS